MKRSGWGMSAPASPAIEVDNVVRVGVGSTPAVLSSHAEGLSRAITKLPRESLPGKSPQRRRLHLILTEDIQGV